ncbi:MAG: hypothetical protein EA412_02445 [Chitinophagaceae bacterium]|nr:MAG: hypothetical protein EA412_02445 [Chitinophagaceae bacterium]
MLLKNLLFIIAVFGIVFLTACSENGQQAEDRDRQQPAETDQTLTETEPQTEVTEEEMDPFEEERAEIIEEIREEYIALEERIESAEELLAALDETVQETYSANITWLQTTMRYISDRKSTLQTATEDGFENIKADIDEQMYQVEEYLGQLEDALDQQI